MVKIIIDSGSDISKKEAEELGIILAPIEVQFGEEQYFDGDTLLPSEFYEKLEKSNELPKTSLVNEFRWTELFEKEINNGNDVVAIILSSKISGTYKCACDASTKFNGKVKVVDSLSATLGQRLLCKYAIRLSSENKTAEEIANLLNEKKNKLHIYAAIDTLKYLKMGGRISSATAFFGEILSIKPLISVVDGEVKVIGKEKGIKKSCIAIKKLIENHNFDFSMPYGLLWSGNNRTNLDKFIQFNSSIWTENNEEISQHILGSTIGSHIGPGAFGFVFFEK
ncbi:MAG: DegV family protein [Clostridia bacterium]|nr:DegV family protein [Clostridia bacterium]